ncbi:RecQ family ATP-dependent DNA helicase [Bacillus sp. HMF5848]|uniref:RecQ family ATP-dependent DNA helicase n=1 Tax=Bacillus sp. HMF5848 TaxID=2495421 RepID=UPI0037C17E20
MKILNLEKTLQSHFGLSSFRPLQREIIEAVMHEKDVLAMLPTGAGKSLCYQLPTYLKQGSTLIVSPLVSLMEDQVQQLRMIGEKHVIAFNSFLSYRDKRIATHQLSNYKFIFASPEMLQNSFFINALQQLNITLFVVDEAHCISQWGHDFRPDYLRLGEVRQQLGEPTCLALTASATPRVLDDIKERLCLHNPSSFYTNIDRPNIAMLVEKVDSLDDKITKALSYCRVLEGPGIIYFSSRSWCERFTALLEKDKSVAFYHAGMEHSERKLVQQQFINNQLDVICATSAFGMGVNKNNVRYVIHFHYPYQLESYLQEIGRAGRDGEPSVAITLITKGDEQLASSLIHQDLPNENQLLAVLSEINGNASSQLTKERERIYQIQFQLSETGWRFIRYHLREQHVVDENDIIQLFELDELYQYLVNQIIARQKDKQYKLQAMHEWLFNSSECRRAQLVAYFQGELQSKPKYCCDTCQPIPLDEFSSPSNQKPEWGNWLDELKALLLHGHVEA